MFAEHCTQGIGNLPKCGITFHRPNEYRHEILTAVCGILQTLQHSLDLRVVSLRPQRLHAGHLLPLEIRIDTQQRWYWLVLERIRIHAHDDPGTGFNFLLILIVTLLNFALGKAEFNGPDRTTHGVDLVEICLGTLLNGFRQGLNSIGATDRVDTYGYPGLMGDDLLCAQCDLDGFFGR